MPFVVEERGKENIVPVRLLNRERLVCISVACVIVVIGDRVVILLVLSAIYADDIVLLAPSASALRRMLSICDSFATSHGLLFNADKNQLICFRARKSASLYHVQQH